MRITSGREKCVDILAKNRALFRKLLAGPTDDEKSEHPEWRGAALDPALSSAKDLELTEPHLMFLSGDLPWRDLEYLSRDIQTFLDLDVREDREYWQACAKLCGDALKKQKAAAFAPGAQHNYSNRGGPGGGRGQYSAASAAAADAPSVKDDLALLLRGKSLSELEELEREIHLVVTGSPHASAALTAMADGLDHTYWEGVARELAHYKSAAYLREFHQALLHARLRDLQQFVRAEEKAEREQREKAYAERIEAAGGGAAGAAAVAAADAESERLEDGLQAEEDELDFEPVLIPHAEFDAGMEDAAAAGGREDSGSFSPTLEAAEDVEERTRGSGGVRAVDPEADARELAEARRAVAEQKQRDMEARAKMEAGSAVAVAPSAAAAVAFGGTLPSAAAAASSSDSDAAFRRESSRALGSDEVRLSSSFAIPEQTYWWGDKFRPRKPRFFNRVKTGFEWNKYGSRTTAQHSTAQSREHSCVPSAQATRRERIWSPLSLTLAPLCCVFVCFSPTGTTVLTTTRRILPRRSCKVTSSTSSTRT